ncbi:MAG: FAD-dependent oxidoreductase [Burkholderiaceae bacterium]
MNKKKLLVFVLVVGAIVAFWYLGLGRYFTLESIKAQQAGLAEAFAAKPWQTALTFFGVYVAVTALSLPGAALLTLLAGAIFGFGWGLLIVSFASSIGATLAFLAARFVLRDWVKGKLGGKLAAIDRGIEREGAFYLFTLRLVPAFPFWVINLVMGLTSLPVRTFYWVSQVGMLLGTMVYVNVGTQLAQLESLAGILSPVLIGSFVLLGILPLVAKRIVETMKSRRVYERWDRPATYDRNLIVIGGGSAGLVSSLIGASVKAKVTLVEGHKMGGDCLNYGCVPSKALIKSAKIANLSRHAAHYGMERIDVRFSFADVMARVQRVVAAVAPHDSEERYQGLGVDVVRGHARITSPWTVEIALHDAHGRPTGEHRTLSTRSIVIATGAQPLVPPIPGLAELEVLTSDNIWQLRELPRRLLVLGGGPIGCELAQSFARLGAQVIQVEMVSRLMAREDPEISQRVMATFRAEGIDVRVNHKAVHFEKRADGTKILVAERVDAAGERVEIEFDAVLCALGRSARLTGYGLEDLEIPVGKRRTIEVDEFLRTNYPNIFAAGDVAGPYQFTHTAAHMAWFASVNALFGRFKRFRVDYRVIPWATFTEPEVARVGLNETDAKEQGIAYEVSRYGIDDLDRAIADGVDHGEVKILTVPGKDRILGVTIVGEHAGDLIAEFVLAMKQGLGLKKILGTIHIYPTLAESNKYAAGEWQKAHIPTKLLEWVARYHAWERS